MPQTYMKCRDECDRQVMILRFKRERDIYARHLPLSTPYVCVCVFVCIVYSNLSSLFKAAVIAASSECVK